MQWIDGHQATPPANLEDCLHEEADCFVDKLAASQAEFLCQLHGGVSPAVR